jgi:TctA family transporter
MFIKQLGLHVERTKKNKRIHYNNKLLSYIFNVIFHFLFVYLTFKIYTFYNNSIFIYLSNLNKYNIRSQKKNNIKAKILYLIVILKNS